MFFRTKSIKGTPLVQLVESFRNAEGLPRQRVVASLGDVAIPEDRRRAIAKAVERQLCGNTDFFESGLDQESAEWVARITRIAGRSKSASHVPATSVDGVMIDEIQTTNVVLYDCTNTHFEGTCVANPKAKHGKNKQKRNDCRQVSIGMAFDEHGLPLAHEVFEGNMADTSTLAAILDRLDIRDEASPDLKPIVILDAGFASKANLALLKERHYHYLVNVTRGSRKKYASFFEKETFEELPGRDLHRKVEVKKITDPEDPDSRLVLCRSAQRRLKEEAMISKAEERFIKDLTALQNRIGEGRLKATDKIERAIGGLQKKHPRVRRFYQLIYIPGVAKSPGQLQAKRHHEEMDEALSLCGDYVLKTDENLEAKELWNLYMTLLRAEAGFKMLKGSLGLRPNFHQIETRVEGHIFISILAYHLLTWVPQKLAEAGDPREWKTLRRLLGTHSLLTTRLPLIDGRMIDIRKPSEPDAAQAHLYQLLGIDWKTACPTRRTEFKKATPSTTL